MATFDTQHLRDLGTIASLNIQLDKLKKRLKDAEKENKRLKRRLEQYQEYNDYCCEQCWSSESS